MSEEIIARAIEHLEYDSTADAMKLVRPLLLDEAYRGKALYVLGLCYEHSGSATTACYLLEESVVSDPDSREAQDRLAACRREVEQQGLTEDFRDAGHTPCASCKLYYRAEYPLCPYCCDVEGDREAERFDPESVVEPADAEVFPWEDETAMEKLQRAGGEVVEKVKEFAESESVKEMTQRAQELGREAATKAKEIARSEPVREVTEQARKTGEDVLQKTRQAIEAEREKFDAADQTDRRILLIKWAAFLLGGWLVLYFLVKIF